jgi:hypothetical protein
MESKTPSRGLNAVKKTLCQSKVQMGIRSVAVFDGNFTNLYATSEESPDAFWDIFSTSPCWSFDHDAWQRELRSRGGSVCHECTCRIRHTADGYLLHDRWIVLIMFEASMPSETLEYVSVIPILLKDLLPKTRPRRRGGTGPLHASVGIPVWWVRGG